MLPFTPLGKGKLCISLPLTDKQLHCDHVVVKANTQHMREIQVHVHVHTRTNTHTHITILCRQHSCLHCPTHHHDMMLNYAEDNSSFALPVM